MGDQEQYVASQQEVEAYVRLPLEERKLTDNLRGVLAETAVTGIIRYPWPQLQPLLAQAMREQLLKYEAEEHVEIGPARPILGNDQDVNQLCERFSSMLAAFTGHPWTLQRLCEVVLEPQKQYKRLHKLALAIEKLLVVTGEVGLSQQPGPLPPLSQLSGVNEALPPPAGSTAAHSVSARQGDADGGGLVAAALTVRHRLQQADAAAAAAAAAAEEPMPAAAAAAADVAHGSSGSATAAAEPMQVDAPGPSVQAGPNAAPSSPPASEAQVTVPATSSAAAAAAAAVPEVGSEAAAPLEETAAGVAGMDADTGPSVTHTGQMNAVSSNGSTAAAAAAAALNS